MADEALFARASSVGKWKSGLTKKYDFCLSRRSEQSLAIALMDSGLNRQHKVIVSI